MSAPSFVTFKWKPAPGYRSTFTAEHVNTWAAMVRRHYQKPLRLICVTDDANGIDPSIETLPLWNDFADLPSPHGGRFPSCYRRLKIFSKEAKDLLGETIVLSDLDCVITDNIVPLVDRDEDFIAWGDTGPGDWAGGYNCSFVRLRAGTRTKVWETFDPENSPRLAQAAKCLGSDQGWISYCLGKGNEPMFRRTDGVYSYPNDIKHKGGALPANARVVFFHGNVDPWSPQAQQLEWVRQHYR